MIYIMQQLIFSINKNLSFFILHLHLHLWFTCFNLAGIHRQKSL